jgi:Leucine-rich repeat (LRR) protein
LIDSVELNCQFKIGSWWVLGEVYTCYADNQGDIITDRFNREITTINGSHQGSNTHANVKGVSIYKSNVYYFPTGLQKIFENLEGIFITYSKLKEVRQEDLKEYKNLRYLNLGENQIEFLEPNLFENNLKLQGIFLPNNKIAHIDANVFDDFVDKVRYLFLSGNICELENSYNNIRKANQIIAKVQTGFCKDETTMTTTTSAP